MLAAQPIWLQVLIVVGITLLAIFTWWQGVKLVNRSVKSYITIRQRLLRISESPIAVAIYSVGVMLAIAYLVEGGFGRFIT